MTRVRLHPFEVRNVQRPLRTGLLGVYVPAGIGLTNAPALWSRGITGAGKIAAVIDTGCDVEHPDLAGRVVEYIDMTGEGLQDDIGHGTHVAGTICACGEIRGVAPEAKLLIIKVIGKSAYCEESRVAVAIRRAVDWRGPNGERVSAINLSLGSDIDAADVHEAIQYAVANNVEPVCAAGNDGDGNPATPELSYPGAYQESVEVAAVSIDGNLTRFSNTNGAIDLAAVGLYVDSTWPQNLGPGRFASLSGTSMATPHITGLLLLEEQLFERLEGRAFRSEAERWTFACVNVRQLPGLPREAQGLGLGYGKAELLAAQPGPFPDVPADDWAADYIRKVKAASIMVGDDQGLFWPDRPPSRRELAKVVCVLKGL
jgi:major intracellular serine protease